MHEFSISSNIVRALMAEVSKIDPPPRRVEKVHVVIGDLYQIVPEYLSTSYDALTRGTIAEASELVIVSASPAGRCRVCGWTGTMKAPVFICGGCARSDVEVTGGKEMLLDRIEVDVP